MSPSQKTIASISIAACAFWASTTACAQIYKGLDENGKTVFSSSPKGLSNVQKIQPGEPAFVDHSPTPTSRSGSYDNRRSESIDAERSIREKKASAEMKPEAPPSMSYSEALQKYEAAKQAISSGEEPIAGERLGIANGGSRLAPSYFERQARLAKELEKAKSDLDEASRTRR